MDRSLTEIQIKSGTLKQASYIFRPVSECV